MNDKFKQMLIGATGGAIVTIVLFLIVMGGEASSKIAEWLSAIGTVGAVIVSLYLARQKNDQDIEGGPIQSLYSYEQSASGQLSASLGMKTLPISDPNNRSEATAFKHETQFRIYNPSDYPKTLIKLGLWYQFGDFEYYQIHTDDSGKEVAYITLESKATKLITVKGNITRQDVLAYGDAKKSDFENLSHLVFSGTNEKGKEVNVKILKIHY